MTIPEAVWTSLFGGALGLFSAWVARGLVSVRVARLQEEVRVLSHRRASIEADLASAEQARIGRATAEHDAQRLRAQIDHMQQERASIESEIQGLRSESSAKVIERDHFDLERSNAEAALAALRDRQTHLLAAVGPLETKIGVLEATKARVAAQVAGLEDSLKRQAADLDEGLNRRRAELAQLDAERRVREQEIAAQATRMAQIHQVEARLRELEKQLERRDLQLRDATREHATLSGQATALAQQRDLLEAAVNELRDEREEIESRLRTLDVDRAELVALERRIQETRAKRAEEEGELERRIRELRASRGQEAKELERTRAHLHDLREAVAKAEESLHRAQQALVDRVPLLQAHVSESLPEARWEGLRIPPIQRGELANPTAAPEEWRTLQAFEAELARAGLQFARRSLLALHTSLKISDVSSLTVLAGVSGTGKSLLPLLYARHLGMHSLLVAVQPRWDSPQDLIGHYDFLQQQFRPTDLSRALWQFERHNRSSGRSGSRAADPDDLSDRVLLVLLDEMNLARVEYYFSELLSRLERRGDIDPTDAVRRRALELSIEIGGGLEGPRLYPDLNVLFVGTMNEDESTQALSDKVLDRANVLRFDAPASLAFGSTRGVQAATAALTYDAWATWRASSAKLEATRNTIEPQVLQVNEALRSIGRPFGHRVFQAIVHYVASYPEVPGAPETARTALTDQIAQRILPKLRGLDTQHDAEVRHCLDEVAAVLEALGDEATIAAFERARRREFFQWSGVAWSEEVR